MLELLFQSSADCIKVLNTDGRLILMNAGGAATMDLTGPGDLVGCDWVAFWSGDERDAARAAVAVACAGGIGRCHGYLPTAKGRPKWWDSVVSPIRRPDGVVTSLLVVSRDVTEREALRERLAAALRRTEAIVLATSDIVWHADAAQTAGTTLGLADFAGEPGDAVTRDTWSTLIHPDDRSPVDALSRASIGDGVPYVCRFRMRHRSGRFRWVEEKVIPLRDEAGVLTEWVGVVTDIDERLAADEALKHSEERLRLAVQASHVGIWDVDLVEGTRRWSPELKTLLGLPDDAAESEELLFSLLHPEDRVLVEGAHRTAFQMTDALIFRIMRADTGALRWLLSSGRAVLDPAGRPVRRIGTLQDITERKEAEAKLWAAANLDPLTGLHNRHRFRTSLETALVVTRAKGTRLALLILDLDHFKHINDTLGHQVGDIVLRTIASRLSESRARSPSIARLGSDEFAILLPDVGTADEVAAFAGTLIRELAAPISYAEMRLKCSASLGLALFPDHDADGGELIKNADVALSAAKRQGRARFTVFNQSMKLAVQRRVMVLQRAREALARHNLVPFYQPKVAFADGAVAGFEALLRWHDRTGLHSPAELREAFDDPDLAGEIGQRMLDRVVEDLLAWRATGLAVGTVAVNVAAAEFSSIDVAERWLTKLDAAGLPPGALQMEVTESVFLGEGSGNVARALDRLHGSGVSIALDDFGTGFASLTHLRQYPVDWLKIDQSFIRDLVSDPGALAIVSAVIGLGHGLGLRVIAEGVETAAQVATLTQRGCDLAQGYLIAKPMAASGVSQFLGGWRGFDRAPSPPRAKARMRLAGP